MKNLYAGLLFMHGHIQDPELAISLAGEDTPQVDEAASTGQPREVVARKARPMQRAWFRSHAVSAVCCATALSPFR
jgi:hypothetical protein